jgi:hypothetical protein
MFVFSVVWHVFFFDIIVVITIIVILRLVNYLDLIYRQKYSKLKFIFEESVEERKMRDSS